MSSRPARPGEVPAFGSVWRWGERGLQRVALRLDREMLVSVVIDGPWAGQTDTSIWTRRSDSSILEDWVCLDEGPDG